MVDSVARFSDRVADYVRYRPDYPVEVVGYLADAVRLVPEWTIADIGCGPGISSRNFLENGNRVIGVEPNEAMRSAAAEYLAGYDRFTCVAGRSDDTGLDDASVDMVLAAQAFHWFDQEATRREFDRILPPGGPVVLMWNLRREEGTTFLVEYEALIRRYGTDYVAIRHADITDDDVRTFLGDDMIKRSFDNKQVLDFDGLKGRLLSSSYVPNAGHPAFEAMVDDLRRLFDKHAVADRIELLYDTVVYHSLNVKYVCKR
jgi:SAM-dependent methyltransferase